MKDMTLAKRLFLGFLLVIVTTCAFSGFVGLRIIDRSIVARIQDKVRLDLRSARDIYEEEVANIREKIRISALSFFADETNLILETARLGPRLNRIAERESLDFLTLSDTFGAVLFRAKNPTRIEETSLGRDLVQKVLGEGQAVVFTDVVSEEDLKTENPEFAERARIQIVPSPYHKSESRSKEASGIAIVAAAPVLDDQEHLLGVLYGGRILNNSAYLVDRIVEKIYGNEIFAGRAFGLATLFLSDIRISTTVRGKDGNRAFGTLVSDDVYDHVLKRGNTWISRPFAVNSRYVTAYEPIKNRSGKIIGMLSIGVLEDRFRDIQKSAFWSFFMITMGGLALSIVLCYFFIRSTMKPIRSLILATQRLANGHLTHQIRLTYSPPEIATLCSAFNSMALSIRDRDSQLRLRAQEEIMKSERLAMIGQLAAGVAHEINNPLGSILLFSRLVSNKCQKGTVMRDNVERIEREVKRCQNIVQGLLDFARQREPKAEPVNLNTLLDKTVALFENQPMFHNIEVSKTYQKVLPLSVVDPAQIQQVFVNIIMNAVDAMEGRGKLGLSTSTPEGTDTIEIGFADSGFGMTQETIDRVFEPFFTTKGVGYGTGLGLSISHGIVQRHGGSIQVFSRINEGSRFVVTLPKAKGGA